MRERDIVARLRRSFPRIGDDGAVVGRQVFTTDMLIEDVDFTRAVPLEAITRKSIAVNLSDLAAMGATPDFILIAAGVPPWVERERFVEAVIAAAESFPVEVIGGDLSQADKLTISITAIGTAERPLLRSTARPGDRLFISRPLGASAAGLFLLQHGWTVEEAPAHLTFTQKELGLSAIRRHIDPEPEVRLGILLGSIADVTACIDVSDGLSTDLHHLCEASGLGASIEKERIPVFADLRENGRSLGVDVSQAVLHGGEEYALLFTSSLTEGELSTRAGRPVYRIGRMTREKDVLLDGKELPVGGFEHFA